MAEPLAPPLCSLVALPLPSYFPHSHSSTLIRINSTRAFPHVSSPTGADDVRLSSHMGEAPYTIFLRPLRHDVFTDPYALRGLSEARSHTCFDTLLPIRRAYRSSLVYLANLGVFLHVSAYVPTYEDVRRIRSSAYPADLLAAWPMLIRKGSALSCLARTGTVASWLVRKHQIVSFMRSPMRLPRQIHVASDIDPQSSCRPPVLPVTRVDSTLYHLGSSGCSHSHIGAKSWPAGLSDIELPLN